MNSCCFEISPGLSIGPFQLGMSRKEIRNQYAGRLISQYTGDDSGQDTDICDDIGIWIFYDEDGMCHDIEAWLTPEPKVQFSLQSRLLTRPRVADLLDICNTMGSNPEMDRKTIDFPGRGLCFWCSNGTQKDALVDSITVYSDNDF